MTSRSQLACSPPPDFPSHSIPYHPPHGPPLSAIPPSEVDHELSVMPQKQSFLGACTGTMLSCFHTQHWAEKIQQQTAYNAHLQASAQMLLSAFLLSRKSTILQVYDSLSCILF